MRYPCDILVATIEPSRKSHLRDGVWQLEAFGGGKFIWSFWWPKDCHVIFPLNVGKFFVGKGKKTTGMRITKIASRLDGCLNPETGSLGTVKACCEET